MVTEETTGVLIKEESPGGGAPAKLRWKLEWRHSGASALACAPAEEVKEEGRREQSASPATTAAATSDGTAEKGQRCEPICRPPLQTVVSCGAPPCVLFLLRILEPTVRFRLFCRRGRSSLKDVQPESSAVSTERAQKRKRETSFASLPEEEPSALLQVGILSSFVFIVVIASYFTRSRRARLRRGDPGACLDVVRGERTDGDFPSPAETDAGGDGRRVCEAVARDPQRGALAAEQTESSSALSPGSGERRARAPSITPTLCLDGGCRSRLPRAAALPRCEPRRAFRQP